MPTATLAAAGPAGPALPVDALPAHALPVDAPPAHALPSHAAQPPPDDGLTGLTGAVADVLVTLGEVGVGLLAAAEVVFPPLPSEVVLPMAGYLARMGRMQLALVVIAATLGALVGNLALYAVGRRLGIERSVRLLARLPLVSEAEAGAGRAWFERHGSAAVFLARFVPVARAMVSLPAGATRLPLGRFVLLTLAGCGAWNGALVAAGYALGTQHERVAGVLERLDLVLLGGVVVAVAWWVLRRRARAVTGRS